ncbi:MAG: AMIN domain-containing protein [Desulfatiglans sp.]|mgnify:CR=1 FL=1|jgi:N-acetylmuramoyl-L-alanine amidase|nr:AMIN domain-containing protein [Desulfatiglans sp.]
MIITANKRYFLTLFLNLVLLFAVFAGNSSEAAPSAGSLLKSADTCRESLYQSSKRMNYRHNWDACIEAYKKIYTGYPKTDQAAWALFHSAGMYIRLNRISSLEKDLDEALLLYERIIKDFPDHRLADDAQYKRGEIYFTNKQDMTQAYMEFLKVEIKFPNGDMRTAAKGMLEKLSALLGEKQEKAAEKPDTSTGTSETGITTVKNIRHWSTPTYTRVVIDIDKPVDYSDHLLKKDPDLDKPRRLYLDIKNSRVGKDIETTIPIKDGLLKTARAGQYTPDTVRVVLDIESISGYKTFRLHDPFRIVIDVQGNNKVAAGGEKRPQKRPVEKGIKKPEKPDDSVSLARQLGLSVKRIVIDPGHGGKDPGCYIDGGIKEKDIVLDMAKRLKARLEKRLNCEVLLTRTTDIFIPLDERTAFANIKKADLFISLHVNAHKDSAIHGIETYFLNMATDKQAVLVAARENATSEKNISDLQSILNDLMLNTKISESSRLAHSVQNGVMGDLKKKYQVNKSLGVKQAPFYVLIGAEMPSILIETGFLTNSTERKKLITDNYKDVISEGISKGIEDYIKSIDMAYSGR